MRNGASASYNALQAQFRHRFAHGLQALLSYTWSHSIDNVSSDAYYANVPPGASSDRGSSTYDIRHTFSGAVSYDIPAPGAGIWKSIFGSWSTDSIIYARTAPPVNIVTGQNTFGLYLSAATSVQRPNLVSGVPALDLRPQRRRTASESTKPHSGPDRTGPGNSRTQRPQRIRRDRGRSHAAPAVQALRAPLPPGPRRLLQHLQPPELRPPDQLHDLSAVRPGDPDARRLARRRRPDRRPQSALPDRRPALGATGAEAYVLSADRRVPSKFPTKTANHIFSSGSYTDVRRPFAPIRRMGLPKAVSFACR